MSTERLFMVLVSALALSGLPAVALADQGACDAVLVQQISVTDTHHSVDLNWLRLITRNNYEEAKHAASGQFLEYFKGSYDDFSARRQQEYDKQKLNLNVEDARYNFTSHLDPGQITAWTDCMGGKHELAGYFEQEAKDGATLVLSWKAPDDVGKLHVTTVSFPKGGADKTLLAIVGTDFKGTRSFPLERKSAAVAIRGTINGVFGANKQAAETHVFLQEYKDATSEPNPVPQRFVVPLNGVVHLSKAYWGGGHSHVDDCIKVPDHFDLVIAREASSGMTHTRGACESLWPACYRWQEACEDVVIQDGCLVNSDWHKWYEDKQKAMGLPVSPSAVCQVSPK